MKHLLNGVTIAAALAIAAPVWAQTGAPMTAPMSPSAAAPSAGMAPETSEIAAPRHHRARPHRTARHATRGRMTGKASADNMASELNQQELSRLQPGGGAPMSSGPMPMQQNGPRPSGH